MKILKFVQSVPAGMLNVPMVVTAVVNTFFPQAYVGGMTTSLFKSGTITLFGLIVFLCGTQFKLSQVISTLERGFVLLVAKMAIGVIGSLIVLRFFPPIGYLGISTIALVAALASTNPGTYLAICSQHGDEIDEKAFGPLNLVTVPSIAIFYMGLGSGNGLDYMVLVQVLAPFLIGMLVGNLDGELAEFFRPGTFIVLPFMGFCCGSAIDLRFVGSAGASGLLLTAFYIVTNLPILFLVDRYILWRPGYASFGVATAAANSITVPGLYAAVEPTFEPFVSAAAAQIAMVVVITAFLMPYLAGYFAAGARGSIDTRPPEPARPLRPNGRQRLWRRRQRGKARGRRPGTAMPDTPR